MKLSLPYLTPGLNGPDGLIRQHFRDANKLKTKLILEFMAQKPRGHRPIKTAIRVIYTRFTSQFMDWDNAGASFKYVGDALVDAGIIADDNPNIVAEFIPKQIKAKRAEQRTEIEIQIL